MSITTSFPSGRGGGGGRNKTRSRVKGRRNGNTNSNTNTNTTAVGEKFRNDDPSLGPMRGKYFDCTNTSAGPVRFTATKDLLAQYVTSTYETGTAILVAMIKDMRLPIFGDPVAYIRVPNKIITDPDTSKKMTVPKEESELNFAEKKSIEFQLKNLHDREESIRQSIKQLFHFIYTRCTDRLQERIKAHKSFSQAEQDGNPVALLNIIREIIFTNTYLPLAMVNQTAKIYSIKQGKKSIASYHTKFQSLVDAAVALGCDFHQPGICMEIMAEQNLTDFDNLSAATKESIEAQAKERYLAILFLQGADPDRFGGVLRDLNKDYSRNIDTFPKTVHDAMDFLTKWEEDEEAVKGEGQGFWY